MDRDGRRGGGGAIVWDQAEVGELRRFTASVISAMPTLHILQGREQNEETV